MSLRSMTGYGRGEAMARGVKVALELSSVNRRQLDIHVSLPRALASLESRVYDAIHSAANRGRITGELVVSRSGKNQARALRIDADLAGAYIRALRKTARALDLEDDLGASALLTLPSVVRFEEPETDALHLWPTVQKALKQALRMLRDMKAQEGKALQADIEQRLDHLGVRVERIRKRAPEVPKAYRKTLTKRIREAGLTLPVNDDRLAKEVLLFADRCDITEELTRLDSHLQQTRKKMHAPPPSGKALDFLAQEMFREINTIGSKANDTLIVGQVVEFKAELERVREQVQNIE